MTKSQSVTFLTREGCVNTAVMRGRLDEALKGLSMSSEYQVVDLDSLPNSDARRGYPTPTVLINGVDLFGYPAPTPPFPEPT